MTDFPPFRPENYPRTYKHAPEMAVYGFVTAGIAGFFGIFCLLVVAIKYHGDFDAGGVCAGIGILGLILTPIGLLAAMAPHLTLTADSIEYRGMDTLYFARRMLRDDINGVRIVYLYSRGQYSTFTAGTTFMPKDEKASSLFVPEWIFKLDETYDAWVGGMPYRGGVYTISHPDYARKTIKLTADDFFKVEWRDHRWMPRKE
jgi:hypothetical protein